MIIRVIYLFVLLFSFNVFAVESFDQNAFEQRLLNEKQLIEKIEFRLNENNLDEQEVLAMRMALRESDGKLSTFVSELVPYEKELRAEIADLGPAPQDPEAQPEPELIQKQRTKLTEALLVLEGMRTQAEALQSKIARLLEKIATARNAQFIEQLLERQVPAFKPDVWFSSTPVMVEQINKIRHAIKSIIAAYPFASAGVALVVLIVLAMSIIWSKPVLSVKQNSKRSDRLSIIAQSLTWPLFAVLASAFFIYNSLLSTAMFDDKNNLLVEASLLLFVAVSMACIVAVRLDKVRLIRPSVCWLIIISAILYAFDNFLLVSARYSGSAVELMIAQSYIVTTIFSLLVISVSLSVLKHSQPKSDYILPKKLFVLFIVSSVLMLSANLFSYAAFSRFIFEHLIVIMALLITVALVRAYIRPYLFKLDQLFSQNDGTIVADHEQEKLLYFWLSLAVDAILLLAVLPVAARIAGVEWLEIVDWAKQAFFGFKVGNLTISIASITFAIVIFMILLFGTKVIQNVLSYKILPKTRIDVSARQSVTQVLGYAGLIIALLAGIAALGFDLTNLALIAGALSVGIGFGLQSIVSNFVSGLILLFERPIKVGDWIITNSGQGIVKKISVRSTEIETFERTTIIVPNSELISSSVKNWTHTDRCGRLNISVGVSYSSDPHRVKEILLSCVADNSRVLTSPEPTVHFREFGDNSLIFDLRFFIQNISDVILMETEMRLLIWDKLKADNIEISFPQRDLHIRSAPGLEELFRHAK